MKIKIKKEKRKKKESSPELQKPNIEAEVYNNNNKMTEEKKNFKSLIRFHSANKINNYNRWRERIKKKKNPEESTEQIKT